MDKEDGSILSFIVILILLMTLLATGSLALAKQELIISGLGRQTSNSYHLARSGAEKVVDTMNKEIAIELPRLMRLASKETHEKLLEEGLKYQYAEGEIVDPYSGKYRGKEHGNPYKISLKSLVYSHIEDKFMGKTPVQSDYKAYSDVKNNIPIIITSKIYNNCSRGVPEDLVTTIKNLPPEAFAVEVVARAKEGRKTTLAKSRVIGIIEFSQLLEDDELLEEYTWGELAGQESIIGFDDLHLTVFEEEYKWSYNNPLEVISQSATIDLSQFESIPTAIVSTNPNATIALEGSDVFNGIIISPGQLNIPDEVIINGWVIAQNEMLGGQVSINYDPDMLLKIHFMDKPLQRRLYDSLNLTNYQGAAELASKGQEDAQEIMTVILGEKGRRKVDISKASVINSEQGGVKFIVKSLRRL